MVETPDSSAYELEDSGQLVEAARAYTFEGIDDLLRGDFQPGDAYRRGVASLYHAISCSLRADLDRQAERLFAMTRPLVEVQIDAADSLLEHVAAEWLGDGLLMLRDPEARTWYERANEGYGDLEMMETTWFHEPESALIQGALQRALRFYGAVPPNDHDRELQMDFPRRIEYKLDLVDEVCEDGEG